MLSPSGLAVHWSRATRRLQHVGLMPRAADDFEVVLAWLDRSPEDLQARRALLSVAERRRAQRFLFDRDRRRFIAARARLRELLGERLGTPPESVELAYGRNGKPHLACGGWHFSVSHCGELALFALAKTSPIGVDVEALRPIRGADAIAAHFFSRREHEAYAGLPARAKLLGFLRCWTRKEALAKALGDGLAMPVDELDAACAAGWRLDNFFPLPGFIAALARHLG